MLMMEMGMCPPPVPPRIVAMLMVFVVYVLVGPGQMQPHANAH